MAEIEIENIGSVESCVWPSGGPLAIGANGDTIALMSVLTKAQPHGSLVVLGPEIAMSVVRSSDRRCACFPTICSSVGVQTFTERLRAISNVFNRCRPVHQRDWVMEHNESRLAMSPTTTDLLRVTSSRTSRVLHKKNSSKRKVTEGKTHICLHFR
jgi:hypothetical protein